MIFGFSALSEKKTLYRVFFASYSGFLKTIGSYTFRIARETNAVAPGLCRGSQSLLSNDMDYKIMASGARISGDLPNVAVYPGGIKPGLLSH